MGFLIFVISTLFIIVALTTNSFYQFNFEAELARTKTKLVRLVRITDDKTYLGKTGSVKKVYISNEAKHIAIFGTTGSGKTVALANFINSGLEYKYPLLIVDGKGDTNKGSILDIVKKLAVKRKIYVINLNNPSTSDKYNPFKNTSPTVIKDMLINMTNWTEEHYKLNTERYLQRLIDLLAKAEIPMSLKNIISYIDGKKFDGLSAEMAKKSVITKAQHADNLELSKNSKEIINGATARFTNLYESDVGQIFDDDGIDIYTAIKENAIILFILNPLQYPEISPLFGNLVVIDSKKAVGNLFNEHIRRIFFIFDEIGVYASNSLLDLVNKSRSANVTCILAAQSPSDLDARINEHFTEQVIENCNNYLVLRQNSAKNAERLAKIIGTRNAMEITYQVNEDGATGLGSARRDRAFLYHPDDIKILKTGQAIFVSKDTHYHALINVHKCF